MFSTIIINAIIFGLIVHGVIFSVIGLYALIDIEGYRYMVRLLVAIDYKLSKKLKQKISNLSTVYLHAE